MDKFSLINKTIILIGKRHSGKSRLLKYLVKYERKKFKKIFVVCPTEKINRFYSDIVSNENIFNDYNEEWTEQLIEKMGDVNANKPDKERKNILLILDDCIAFMNMHQSPTIKKLFSMGRHLNISVIITTQHLYSISPLMRSNADWLFVGQMNKQSTDLLSQEFLSGDITKEEFIKMINRGTKDYSFVIINCNSVKDNDLNSLYGIIKVPEQFVE
jgi:hypothetical protein